MAELDFVLLLEEAGRAALPEPLLETVGVAAPLLTDVAPAAVADDWLPRIATGDAVVTVAIGGQSLVPDAHVADLLLVGRSDRVVAVAGDALRIVAQPSVDGARRLFDVMWDPDVEQPLVTGDAAERAIADSFDRGALAAAAELIGLAQHLLDTTVEYVKQRQQFGVPIGSFQAVKHHLADAVLHLEFARPVVYSAAYATAHGLPTRAREVSMAKAMASDAAALVAAKALQCHGAIAYTVEYDLHLWLKRVWALNRAWGDASWHRRRVGLSVLGPPQAH
jgi:alkylation response protein AidB-like acyl-CoA dehydrogenase